MACPAPMAHIPALAGSARRTRCRRRKKFAFTHPVPEGIASALAGLAMIRWCCCPNRGVFRVGRRDPLRLGDDRHVDCRRVSTLSQHAERLISLAEWKLVGADVLQRIAARADDPKRLLHGLIVASADPFHRQL